MRTQIATATLISVFALMPAAQSQAPPAGRPDNYYVAGHRIDITSPVAGDLVMAGRYLTIGQPVTGDVLAAGWRISLLKPAADDVRLVGAEIDIDAPIDGDLTVAGGEVVTGSRTIVGGRAWVAGSNVRIEGRFDRELKVAGAHVTIAGEIRSPLEIVADQVEILPAARVLGPLTYHSPSQARIGTGATISGPVTYRRIDPDQAKQARWPSPVSTFLFIVHLSIAGFVFFMLFPRFASAGVEALRAQPGRSLAVGILLIVMVPVTALVLLITIIGAPLGIVLVSIFVVMLLVGLVTTAEYIGELEVKWLHAGPVVQRLHYLRTVVLGVLTLAILRSALGGWIVVPAILFGIGAFGLWTYRHYVMTTRATAAGGSAISPSSPVRA